MRTTVFKCPGGCGAHLKIIGPVPDKKYVCPGCGLSFCFTELAPYREKKKSKPRMTSEQAKFKFKARTPVGREYLEQRTLTEERLKKPWRRQ